MKKILSLLTLLLVLASTVSCNQVQGEAQNFDELKKQHKDLVNKFNAMHEEFELMKWGLEQKGLSLAQMKMEKEMAEKVWTIPVDGSPVAGNPSAPIVIVEFSDFQCPYCNRVAPEVKAISDAYPTQVAVVYKHFPLSFHKQAPAAHAAAIAAHAQGKFWEFRYAIAPFFKELTPAKFKEVAQKIGLDMAKFEKDMVLAGKNQTKIDDDMKLGMKVGVRGTPSFYVNGKKIERFSKAMIDQMVKDLK